MNHQYAYEHDKPWEFHPDADTPINDLDLPVETDERPF